MRIKIRLCVLLVSVSLFSCKTKNERKNIQTVQAKDIQNQISNLMDSILGERDSCVVANYILDSLTFSQQRYLVNNNIVFSHYTCPDNNFSFVVLSRINSTISKAYPLNDIFALRHWHNKTDSMKLVQIKPSFPAIADFWELDPQLRDGDISTFLGAILNEFYVEKIGNRYLSILVPIDFEDLADILSPEQVQNIKDSIPGNKMLFLDKYFGVVIFGWERVSSNIQISEFLVPFRKHRMLGLDVATEYSQKCN
jgi:hypothetical protein